DGDRLPGIRHRLRPPAGPGCHRGDPGDAGLLARPGRGHRLLRRMPGRRRRAVRRRDRRRPGPRWTRLHDVDWIDREDAVDVGRPPSARGCAGVADPVGDRGRCHRQLGPTLDRGDGAGRRRVAADRRVRARLSSRQVATAVWHSDAMALVAPRIELRRTEENAAEIDALTERFDGAVGVEGVIANLSRQARPATTEGSAVTRAYAWRSEENWDSRWWPQ